MTTSATPSCNQVEILSRASFEETVDRLVRAIRGAGLLLISQIDHAEGARAAGLEMPATMVLVYGHPRGGTPVMLAVPSAALDLPLRVLVREVSPDLTVASFHPVVPMLERLGVPTELARPLERAQDLIRDALRP